MGFKGSTPLGTEGNPQACESSWRPCLSVYSPEPQRRPPVEECPGQRFQVSQLLFHLHSALGPGPDVLLQPYLSSWDELIKFMESLGPVVEFFSQKVKSKVSLLRGLARQDWEGRAETGGEKGEDGGPVGGPYTSVRSMMRWELARGAVDFRRQTGSGCRTLLRLHRALLWLQLFLRGMGEEPGAGGRPQSPSELCREAYGRALAPHHPWLLRQAAELAFLAMPEWDTFFQLVCVQSHQEAGPVLDRVVRAIEEVYSRTQGALEEHGMLELP
ncbi:LOW QUALITY PROTEIN: ceramide-1-phosphate transfer protein-like [Megalops cyprinoides]|uniref:LOW QUALITY PROTEIN: ceramide-1-phosphate transfer protein-like n=1 Tax=Megalops cyprinoides TaxID=118141 RepID=UPI001864C4B0|nr:LOW QUALITY PROTEIN: ceramide-1-phosphate transfer protein-like [Megalops cyprinoides]